MTGPPESINETTADVASRTYHKNAIPHRTLLPGFKHLYPRTNGKGQRIRASRFSFWAELSGLACLHAEVRHTSGKAFGASESDTNEDVNHAFEVSAALQNDYIPICGDRVQPIIFSGQ
jgi:hypothetical protein